MDSFHRGSTMTSFKYLVEGAYDLQDKGTVNAFQ